MFKSIKGKLGLTAGIVALLSLFVFGQLGPLVRFPDGTESAPGLALYVERNMGFYKDASADMGFGFETMSFEGPTADAFETQIFVEDPTVDTTYNVRAPSVANTMDLVAVNEDSQVQSWLLNPMMGMLTSVSILADATATDSQMIVQTFYLPFPMTVGAIYGIAEEGADKANDTGYLGAAIYENADAGVKLFTCSVADLDATAVVDCDGTDVVLEAGTYRIGFCSENVSDMMWGGALPEELDVGVMLAQMPILSNPIAEAANDCTGSSAEVPAATTGALTDNVTEVPFWALGQD